MAKKKPEPDADSFYNWPSTTPPELQVATIIYGNGRKVTIDDVGDRALHEEMCENVKLRELHRVFGGTSLHELRELAQELAEAEQEWVSKRNSRPGPRKTQATKEQLLVHREAFLAKEGHLRGWVTAVCIDYGITPKTLTARLKK